MKPAVFLDRDGVLIRYKRLLHDAGDIEIPVGVPEALAKLRAAGYLIVVVTNQPAVARGLLSEAELQELHEALRTQLRERGADVDAIYYCPHHPEADVAAYRKVCACRKPGTGMLDLAAREHDIDMEHSIFVGDESRDIQAGYTAGIMTILVEHPAAIHAREASPVQPDAAVSDLPAATALIISRTISRHAH